MAASEHSLSAGDVVFAVFSLLVVGLVLPAQLASLIAFDSTGIDTLVPDLVFMTLVPAAAIATLIGLPAWWRYSARTALAITTAAFVFCSLVAAYLTRFYGMCGGPGC